MILHKSLLYFAILMLVLLASSCGFGSKAYDAKMAQAVRATVAARPSPTPNLAVIARAVKATVAARPTPSQADKRDAGPSGGKEKKQAKKIKRDEPKLNPSIEDDHGLSPQEKDVAILINQQRAQHGLPSLKISHELTQSASRHSIDMATNGLIWHDGPDGSTDEQRIREAGYIGELSDEAIAYGYQTAASAVEWWMSEKDHRPLLLSPQFTEIGISYSRSDTGSFRHYWVVNLGKRTPAQALSSTDRVEAPIVSIKPDVQPQPAEEFQMLSVKPTPQYESKTEPASPTSSTQPQSAVSCPATSANRYERIPMTGVDANHPDSLHGDLNLYQRGYAAINGEHTLIVINGPTDGSAPRLTTLFGSPQTRAISSLYQVNEWDWGCGRHGCSGPPLAKPGVTIMGLDASPGEALYAPDRQNEIYGGGFVAAVLYAEADQITLAYTRDGSVAHGYAVHLDKICVDPNLLKAYQAANGAGRTELPAVRAGDSLGQARGPVVVAIRDRGTFMDPRSRKDWWH